MIQIGGFAWKLGTEMATGEVQAQSGHAILQPQLDMCLNGKYEIFVLYGYL